MGEVYRATDINLKRQVAIKVLPAAVAMDAKRLARFRREAELLTALNHPNIANIHGLQQTVTMGSTSRSKSGMRTASSSWLATHAREIPASSREALRGSKTIAWHTVTCPTIVRIA
jgi:serine/threonine protein kinase